MTAVNIKTLQFQLVKHTIKWIGILSVFFVVVVEHVRNIQFYKRIYLQIEFSVLYNFFKIISNKSFEII